MKTIIILDCKSGTVFIRKFNFDLETVEDILDRLNLSIGQCNWMYANSLKFDICFGAEEKTQ